MVTTIGNFASMFANYVELFIDVSKFVIDFFVDLVFIGDLALAVTGNVPQLFSWLPASCVTLLTLCLGVVVVYKIFGRES